MERLLQDRIAVITGGGQGLGQAICQRLAEQGCHVVVADINLENASTTAASIQGRRAIAMQTDVTDEAQVAALMEKTMAEFGRLDILVSNAGILLSGAITDFPAEKWRAVIKVNLIGYFLVVKHAARIMIAQKSGNIIQINSKSGKEGSYRNSAYAASKFGGVGFTRSIALELAEHGIRVNAICPGNLLDSPLWTDSLYKQYAQRWNISEEEVRQRYIDKVPLKRGCTYDDVCNLLVFLASDQSTYMTGQSFNVTGGQVMY